MRLGRFVSGLFLATIGFVALIRCGSDSAGSISEWVDSFESFTVASPTTLSSASVFAALYRPRLVASLDGDESLEEKLDKLDEIAAGSGAGGCNVTLPSFNGLAGRAACYGPSINYVDHQDSDDPMNPVDGSLPTQDLGFWSAEEAGGTACAAAQLDALMSATAAYVDAALMMEASAICVLTAASTAFPAEGTSVSFATEMQTSLQELNPSATMTAATATAVSSDVIEWNFAGTTDGMKTFDITIKSKKSSETAFQGRVYGYFTTMNKDAFSVTYRKEDSDAKARLQAGSWTGATADSAIFESNGDLKFDDSFSGNLNQAILNVNLDTKAASVAYGWQAGPGDDKTRVFNVYTESSGGTLSGCGYFGYGDDFEPADVDAAKAIDGFVCNWAGPGNDHTMSTTTNKAQKQCFAESSGVMAETVPKRAITYAPTVSCNDTSAMTYDWPSHSGDTASNNLVDLTTDIDFPSYTAPTAPSLDSGF